MKFTVQDQLTTLYTAIEDSEELGRAARNPFTPEKLVDIALTVIKNTGDYQQGILEWYQQPLANQTYPAFKTHFNRHCRLLKKSRGASMQAAGFHSANEIYEEVKDVKNESLEIKEAQSTIVSSILDNETVLTQVANQISYKQPPPFVHMQETPV